MTKDLISRADALARLESVAQAADEADLPDRRDGLRDAMVAIRALPAYEVAVRELEWVGQSGFWESETKFGKYYIYKTPDGYEYGFSGEEFGHIGFDADVSPHQYPLDAAKAAAQADYAARMKEAKA